MLSGKAFQTQITKAIKDSKTIIPQDSKWKSINLNPSAPSIKGLVKNKPEQPILPIVNWHHAPAYKLSKLFTNKIYDIAPLPNAFNVKNTKKLIQNLRHPMVTTLHLCITIHKKNLYPNIPVKETKTILENMLTQNVVDPQTQQELLNWYDVISKQNYFTNNDIIIQPCNGHPILRPYCRNFFTAHGTSTLSTPNTQTQNYKLLAICRRHPASL